MAQHDLAKTSRDMIDAYNAADRNRMKAAIAVDLRYEEVATGRRIDGADAVIETWETWRQAMPDLRGTVTNTVVSGNTVLQEVTWEGTHSGPLTLPGGLVPPSGKRPVTRAAQVMIFEGNKVKTFRHYFDMLNFMQQIGALPAEFPVQARRAGG